MSRPPARAEAKRDDAPFTPSQVSRLIEQTLKSSLPATLSVRGEISNFSRNRTSGHCYLTLKDAGGTLDAVMWASRAERLKFEPRDGMDVLARGSIGVYVPRGRYQLTLDSIEPVGEGAQQLAKRQLIERLGNEGLLDPDRKRPLPTFPRRVLIISSPQAAGFADVMKVLRRFRAVQPIVMPVSVQGRAAAGDVATALARVKRVKDRADVVLLCRGGGSIEDLAAFDDETVARAIVACALPVVTGIGHEIDVSVADLVADHHAHTPTEAATFITRFWTTAAERLAGIEHRLARDLRRLAGDAAAQLDSIQRHEFFRRPIAMLRPHQQRVDEAQERLRRALQTRAGSAARTIERFAMGLSDRPLRRRVRLSRDRVEQIDDRIRHRLAQTIALRRTQIDSLDARLRALSPDAVLARGFSITTNANGELIRRAADVKAGERLTTRTSDGSIESVVRDTRQGELF